MNRRIETALRSKYNFRKQCPIEGNERVVCSRLLMISLALVNPQRGKSLELATYVLVIDGNERVCVERRLSQLARVYI